MNITELKSHLLTLNEMAGERRGSGWTQGYISALADNHLITEQEFEDLLLWSQSDLM